MNNITLYFLFNILAIVVFSFVYYYFDDGFKNIKNKKTNNYIDYFGLSTTLQSTVGLTDILPITNRTKMIVNLQQILSIGGFALILFYLGFKDKDILYE